MARDVRRVPVPVRDAALERALARLDEFAALPENRDSYGATAPRAETVDLARTLVLAVAEPAIHRARPDVPSTSAPVPDGGIQVEWHGPAARIEVQVAPDGSLGYLIERSGEGGPRFEEAEDLPFAAVAAVVQRRIVDSGPAQDCRPDSRPCPCS